MSGSKVIHVIKVIRQVQRMNDLTHFDHNGLPWNHLNLWGQFSWIMGFLLTSGGVIFRGCVSFQFHSMKYYSF